MAALALAAWLPGGIAAGEPKRPPRFCDEPYPWLGPPPAAPAEAVFAPALALPFSRDPLPEELRRDPDDALDEIAAASGVVGVQAAVA